MGAEVEKRIELKEGVPISLLKFDFGNPRKISNSILAIPGKSQKRKKKSCGGPCRHMEILG